MKYIKKFEAHTDYERYRNSQDYTAPNVSYCVDQDEVHFDEYLPEETSIIATYNIMGKGDIVTQIVGYVEGRQSYCLEGLFEHIFVDDVELNRRDFQVNGTYTLSIGTHTLKYDMYDKTTIGNEAFHGCDMETVIIPSQVTAIGNRCFRYCYNLTSITIPETVESIGEFAFGSCSGLTSITIPDSVRNISASLFNGCTGLTSIELHARVTSIGNNAFDNCTGLESITINSIAPPTLSNINAFNSTNNCPIYVPALSINTYRNASVWSSLASRLQPILGGEILG